jgi:hypothetical protein
MRCRRMTLINIMKQPILSIWPLLCVVVCGQGALPQNSLGQDRSEAQISVRISAEKTRFRPQEEIPLRVEIWNVGKNDVFILKTIQANFSNGLSYLDLTVYRGAQNQRRLAVSASDSFSGERSNYPPLAEELSRYWIAIPQGHFYGGNVVMHSSSYPLLGSPGRYRIQGKYRSRGFLARDINNPLLHYADELRKLPYNSWVGEVETNSIWIEVTK